MTKPLTKNQRAVLGAIVRLERETGAYVARVHIGRETRIESRYLTTTVVSLMDRGLIENAQQGLALYRTTESGRAFVDEEGFR